MCSLSVGRFFISGPAVFHEGVLEEVFVQMGGSHLNKSVTLYLEHESSGIVVSQKETVSCASEDDVKTVKLMVGNVLRGSEHERSGEVHGSRPPHR